MPVKKQARQVASGLTSAFIELWPDPIITTRAPASDDQGYLGQIWVNKSSNTFYALTSINSSGQSTWTGLAAAGATITDLDVTNTATFSYLGTGSLLTDSNGLISASNAAKGYVLAGADVGSTPSFAQLTSSDHTVSIDSSGAGIIDFKIPGAGSHWEVVDADQVLEVNHSYIVDDTTAGVRVDLTLPASAVVGSIIKIVLQGTTFGWRVLQGANQQIRIANSWTAGINTTAGAGGYLDCINPNDSTVSGYAYVEIVCVTADLEWNVLSYSGELNLA